MRELMKYAFLGILAYLFLIPTVQSQSVSMVQYRHVSAENRADFIHRETTYWSEIAKAAIKDGKMVNWGLWEKVGGWNLPGGSNFIFVNTFSKPADMDHINEIWNPTKIFPNARMSDMETNSLSTLNHQLIFQLNAETGTGVAPEFVRVNYAKASDMNKYLELEKTMWMPFIKGQMDSKNTSQVYWGSSVKVMPSGADFPFNAISVDGYTKMSEAVFSSTSFKTEPTFPDFTEINDVHVKQRIQVYRKVKVVNQATN